LLTGQNETCHPYEQSSYVIGCIFPLISQALGANSTILLHPMTVEVYFQTIWFWDLIWNEW